MPTDNQLWRKIAVDLGISPSQGTTTNNLLRAIAVKLGVTNLALTDNALLKQIARIVGVTSLRQSSNGLLRQIAVARGVTGNLSTDNQVLGRIAAVGLVSSATPIAIPNFSFESPAQTAGASSLTATGWTTNTTASGVINLTGQGKISPDSIDGSQVAFVGGGTQFSISLLDLFENRSYVFSYSIGRRNDIAYPISVDVQCGDGVFDTPPTPAIGTWLSRSLTFTPKSYEIGSQISIIFNSNGSQSRIVLIDNVTLAKF